MPPKKQRGKNLIIKTLTLEDQTPELLWTSR
jgi:hypothetical protein